MDFRQGFTFLIIIFFFAGDYDMEKDAAKIVQLDTVFDESTTHVSGTVAQAGEDGDVVPRKVPGRANYRMSDRMDLSISLYLYFCSHTRAHTSHI